MLGDQYLVAPMVTKGNSRTVMLPKVMERRRREKFKGPCKITVEVPLERLPYYKKIH